MILAQSLSPETAVKLLTGAVAIWMLDRGWRIHSQVHPHGCWQEALVFSLMPSLQRATSYSQRGIWLPPAWVIKGRIERERKKENSQYGSHSVLDNIFSEVTYHHFLPYSAGQPDQPRYVVGGATERCEHQGTGAAGGHLWGWLPHKPPWIFINV